MDGPEIRMKNIDHAVYEIVDGARRFTARFFNCSDESCRLTPDEIEVEGVVSEGFCQPKYIGKVGRSMDQFKAAEEILARHYGEARMVEANYSWNPNRIVY